MRRYFIFLITILLLCGCTSFNSVDTIEEDSKITSIHLYDFYINDNNSDIELNGTWTINGDEFFGKRYSLDSVEQFQVIYHFDNNEYYFIRSNPEAEMISEDTIYFPALSINDDCDYFGVEFQPYSTVLLCGEIEKVNSNCKILDNQISGLMRKDRIEFTVIDNYSLYSCDLNLIDMKRVSGKKTYVFEIPEKTCRTEFHLEIIEDDNIYLAPMIHDASISLCDADTKEELTVSSNVDESTKVILSIKPLSGYYIEGADVYDNEYKRLITYKKAQQIIQNIPQNYSITPLIRIQVQPTDSLGNFDFKINDQWIRSMGAMVREGDKITFSYQLTTDKYTTVTIEPQFSLKKVLFGGYGPAVEEYIVTVNRSMDNNYFRRKDYFSLIYRTTN